MYRPDIPLGYQNVTTTEQLSGRSVDGTPTYVKLVKRSGAMGTGLLTVVHGIAGVTRFIQIEAGCQDTLPTWIPIPLAIVSASGAQFGLACHADATSVYFEIGTNWAVTSALSTLWIFLEYTK